jgi:hypothetical protein
MYHDREVDGISSFDQVFTGLEVCFCSRFVFG